MKKVEEMCIKLGNASGTPVSQSDVLVIGINGAKSKLLLSEFVKGYSHSDDEVKGYCFLFAKKAELIDNRIKLNDDILISFFRQSNDEEIVVTKIFPHWFQGNDKEIDDELQTQIIREEYMRMNAEVMEEVKEEIALATEESIVQKPIQEEVRTEDGYKSNAHKAICLLGLEACELALAEAALPEGSVTAINIAESIQPSLKVAGQVFEMDSQSEQFKAIKQRARDAAKYLGATQPVEFKYTQEVHEFLTDLLVVSILP